MARAGWPGESAVGMSEAQLLGGREWWPLPGPVPWGGKPPSCGSCLGPPISCEGGMEGWVSELVGQGRLVGFQSNSVPLWGPWPSFWKSVQLAAEPASWVGVGPGAGESAGAGRADSGAPGGSLGCAPRFFDVWEQSASFFQFLFLAFDRFRL